MSPAGQAGPVTGTNFRLGFTWKIWARFPRWDKAEYPGNEFWREMRESKQTCETQKSDNVRAYHSCGNSYGCITEVKWDVYDVENTAGNAGRCSPGRQSSSRKTGWIAHMEKLFSQLTEIPVEKTDISGTEPARPVIWTHRNFYKGFRSKASPRKTGKPGQPGPCKEALNLLLFLTFSLPTSRGIVKSLVIGYVTLFAIFLKS